MATTANADPPSPQRADAESTSPGSDCSGKFRYSGFINDNFGFLNHVDDLQHRSSIGEEDEAAVDDGRRDDAQTRERSTSSVSSAEQTTDCTRGLERKFDIFKKMKKLSVKSQKQSSSTFYVDMTTDGPQQRSPTFPPYTDKYTDHRGNQCNNVDTVFECGADDDIFSSEKVVTGNNGSINNGELIREKRGDEEIVNLRKKPSLANDSVEPSLASEVYVPNTNGSEVCDDADSDVFEKSVSNPALISALQGEPPASASSEDDEDDDEDAGMYTESHRHSRWLYIGSNDELRLSPVPSEGAESSAGSEPYDDSYMDEVTDSSGNLDGEQTDEQLRSSRGHRRVDSLSSTASEKDFRKKFHAVSLRSVQRKNSTQNYQRTSERYCEAERPVVLEKSKKTDSFGFHVKGNKPTYVSTVDTGGIADKAGVQVGDILISVNGVKVIDSDHDEVIKLLTQDDSRIMMELSHTGSQSYTMSYDDEPVVSGYLIKQCGTGLLKSWRRRWFLLKQDNCLYYYKTEKDTSPLGAIMLKNFVITKATNFNRKYTFRASKFGTKTYYFTAQSERDMIRWATAMNAAAYSKHKDGFVHVTSQNVDIPALAIKHPDCHGHLCKLGIIKRLWRRRYCVLKDAVMYYYQDLNSVTALGVAHLHGYTVEETTTLGRKFSFVLTPPEVSMKAFNFSADNETDFKRWTSALRKSISRWIKAE
ncbi:uncharacterized protein LOC141909617 [Tubulanus polymorphus]|uniref:uncharacterized protein LOC141909617 n=1 Tax=Tubulanus polymorphus TaxID=672921 RepID=UPI003DA6B666